MYSVHKLPNLFINFTPLCDIEKAVKKRMKTLAKTLKPAKGFKEGKHDSKKGDNGKKGCIGECGCSNKIVIFNKPSVHEINKTCQINRNSGEDGNGLDILFPNYL